MCLLFCQPQIKLLSAYLPKATHPEGPQSPEGPILPEEPTMPEAPIAPVSPTTPGLAGWRRARAATWRSASAWAASAASWLNAWGACPAAADYWVLDTDYDNFASVYACVDVLGIIHIEFAWVLVRDPQNVTYELMEQALNAYKTQGLSVDNFLPVSHENCGDYENPSGAEVCSGGGR